MATHLKDVRKVNDAFHRRSANQLRDEIKRQVSKVFATALECIEIRFGRDFQGYEEIRSKILTSGNDAVRHLERRICDDYNVQKIPNLTIVVNNPEDK